MENKQNGDDVMEAEVEVVKDIEVVEEIMMEQIGDTRKRHFDETGLVTVHIMFSAIAGSSSQFPVNNPFEILQDVIYEQEGSVGSTHTVMENINPNVVVGEAHSFSVIGGSSPHIHFAKKTPHGPGGLHQRGTDLKKLICYR